MCTSACPIAAACRPTSRRARATAPHATTRARARCACGRRWRATFSRARPIRAPSSRRSLPAGAQARTRRRPAVEGVGQRESSERAAREQRRRWRACPRTQVQPARAGSGRPSRPPERRTPG
eukprot:325812-Prymnesium_polylepis.1